jgi:hypothetical protein
MQQPQQQPKRSFIAKVFRGHHPGAGYTAQPGELPEHPPASPPAVQRGAAAPHLRLPSSGPGAPPPQQGRSSGRGSPFTMASPTHSFGSFDSSSDSGGEEAGGGVTAVVAAGARCVRERARRARLGAAAAAARQLLLRPAHRLLVPPAAGRRACHRP